MALQFPASASIGQTYQSGSSPTYTYNGIVWTLSAGNNGIASLNAYTASLKTALQTTGSTATILGNLNVQGTQTALNQASLQITDKFIKVASGSLTSAQSDGAGIRIDGANVTMSWDSSNSQLTFNTQISASKFVGDGSSLTGISSYTNSDNLAYLNTKGVISGSSQVVGILSSLNTYTGSNDTKWSTIQNVTSSLINATSSYETKGRGIVSGSSQLTSSFDTRYAPSASYITSINGAISSSAQVTNGSGIISSSAQLPSGLISGSSQLTASYDSRYVISGSITQTTWDNIASKPSGIISGSSQLPTLATTGSNTFIGTETISGSLLLSGSFSYNGTPLQNGFAFAQPTLTRILDNVSYTGSSAWVTSYNGNGGAIIVTANMSGFRSTTGTGTAQLYRDGVAVASQTFYFNIANYHTPLTPIVYTRNSETGSHTYSIYFNGISADVNDYATINVLEYGNSAMFPTTIISGSSQLTASFDTRYLTIGGNNVVSGSSQLTASYDTRYTLSGSVGATPAGTISGSSQLTSSFDVRYALSGSGGSTTIPAGTVSGSSQLTSSYDGRYLLTQSFNSFTASAQTVTTGSNSFNGNQVITGSLTITTGSFFASQITANTASLYLTSGSNLYVQNNGIVEITGSLLFSGSSATFNVPALIVNGRGGDEGGEINLAVAVTNTSLQNRVTTDIWQNRYRIFEGSANAKGVFVDLSKAPAGVGGELMWKASGLVNLGVDVTLGDLKARLPSTGNKSLQLSTTSAGVTYSVYGSGIYSQAGTVVGTTINASSPLSITSTPTYLASGYNFGTAGATDTWIIMDTSNTISWRITMILGSGFNNNMISIERLV